jgi:hypothetical protein
MAAGSQLGSPLQSCPKNRQNQYWLEVEMIGEDDSPIPWEEFVVIPASGEKIKGVLDKNGWARVDGLQESGIYRISFPRLDKDTWEFIQSKPERGAAGERP